MPPKAGGSPKTGKPVGLTEVNFMKEECFYKKYIAGVIAKSNQQCAVINSNVVYAELTKWLRLKEIKLSSEMFKAVLAVGRSLTSEYLKTGEVSIKNTCSNFAMSFHTGTGLDGTHTSSSTLKKYVEEFWPVLKKRLDEERDLGDVRLRYRRADVVKIGKLFDEILKHVDEDKKANVLSLMDEFVRSDLQD